MRRKEKFREGKIYHIVNRSIAGFNIFKDWNNCQKFIDILEYYNNEKNQISFSKYLTKHKYQYKDLLVLPEFPCVKFIAFNIMPTHYHLVIKIIDEKNFSSYISAVENSFSRNFNIMYNRKGPLWESAFKAVYVRTEEQLLHVTRYVHLNPVTDYLVENPEDWKFSSYKDYIQNPDILGKIITELSIKNPKLYRKFVEDQKDYQRKLKVIKRLLFE